MVSLKPPRHCPKVYVEDLTIAAPTRLIHRANMLKRLVYKIIKRAQTGYKRDYDKKVRFERRFAVSENVLVDRPPLKRRPAGCLAVKSYTKLLPQHLGTYRILNVGSEGGLERASFRGICFGIRSRLSSASSVKFLSVYNNF